MNKTGCGDRTTANVERAIREVARARVGSLWEWEHYRCGEVIDRWAEHNLCTDEGLNYLLGAGFSAVTAITTWYIAVFNNNHTPAAGNTYATPGFTEATNYSGDRKQWEEAGVAAKSITNSANKASLTFTSAATIYGAALVGGGSDADTKGDKAGGGTLYNLSQFSSGAKSMASSDVLKVTVTLTAQDV
jgi:hypothetical protein